MKSPFSFVGFGDSITEAVIQIERPEDRWVSIVGARLEQAFPEREIRAINSGVGGNTSREGRARLEQDVLAHGPDLVTLEFGNDPVHDSDRYVSLEEFRLNLELFRRRIVDETGATLVLLVFPPIRNDWHAWGSHEFHAPYGGIEEHEELYRQAMREFAQIHELPLVDLHSLIRTAAEAEGWERFLLPDGIHLTVAGNVLVADAVFSAVHDLMTSTAIR